MIDMDSRLRVARGIAKTETEASIQVFETLKARGHPNQSPLTVSDGWGGIREAMVEVYGTIPPYSGCERLPTRKTLAFSKKLSLHQAAAAFHDVVYNFVRPLKTLRVELFDHAHRRWQPRTPAMAAKLTDSIWTVKVLLTVVPLPTAVNT